MVCADPPADPAGHSSWASRRPRTTTARGGARSTCGLRRTPPAGALRRPPVPPPRAAPATPTATAPAALTPFGRRVRELRAARRGAAAQAHGGASGRCPSAYLSALERGVERGRPTFTRVLPVWLCRIPLFRRDLGRRRTTSSASPSCPTPRRAIPCRGSCGAYGGGGSLAKNTGALARGDHGPRRWAAVRRPVSAILDAPRAPAAADETPAGFDGIGPSAGV